MPTPRKERFLASYRDQLGVPFIMGIGGSLDVIAGHVRRAPPYMQSIGLEWLYRVYQEPRRMWWRYLRTNTIFAGILVSGIVRRCIRVPGRSLSRAD
jgi:N-acetylglucosaminyldiphosphoundecaprenol N-acetyl-beta-D-mannosaminyltransferase